jgi:hypothetical protein
MSSDVMMILINEKYLHVLHNQLANIESERAVGLTSILNTSFGYMYGMGPSPIANKAMKNSIKINERTAKIRSFKTFIIS